MSEQDVRDLVMPELMDNYGTKYGALGGEAGLNAYVIKLADIPPVALKKGWDCLIRERVASTKPTIGEIRKACLPFMPTIKNYKYPPSKKQCFSTPQGQYALNKGHGHDFFIECWQLKKIISQHETEKLIALMMASSARCRDEKDERLKIIFARNAKTVLDLEQAFWEKYHV